MVTVVKQFDCWLVLLNLTQAQAIGWGRSTYTDLFFLSRQDSMTINKYLKQSRDDLNYTGVYAKICKNTNKNTINFHKVLVNQSLPVEDPKLVLLNI